MTENMILVDGAAMRAEFGLQDYQYTSERLNGKAKIRGCYSTIKGEVYRETFHGKKLLGKIRLERAALNMPMLTQFIQKLNLPC
jgi:hypothetical protein